MRLELHPNGRNDGLNTHLSIFVRLMKSEYDGILPWPFDKKVTITLIDQQPCPKLRRNIHRGKSSEYRFRILQICYAGAA